MVVLRFILDDFGYWLVRLMGDRFYYSLPYQGVIADLHGAINTGTIQSFDGKSEIKFPMLANEHNLMCYGVGIGDSVTYRIYRARAIHIKLYERKNFYENWLWCINCQRYVRYNESIKENEERSDWGGAYYYYCPACLAELKEGGQFYPFQLQKIYELYKSGAFTAEAEAEFKRAWHDSILMTAFMRRFTDNLP